MMMIENRTGRKLLLNLGFRIEPEPRETIMLFPDETKMTGFDKVVINDG
jgi:hypothetical protein